jgi:5-methylcytosine-specific restriction endonuclease McrA
MKINRQQVFEKYNGRCAYCGVQLTKGWQVDHIHPNINGGTDDFENLNPACNSCNNYKSGNSLELFRILMKQMLNEKLEYLFKSKSKMNIAINTGVVTLKKWNGKFYFETLNNKP